MPAEPVCPTTVIHRFPTHAARTQRAAPSSFVQVCEARTLGFAGEDETDDRQDRIRPRGRAGKTTVYGFLIFSLRVRGVTAAERTGAWQ